MIRPNDAFADNFHTSSNIDDFISPRLRLITREYGNGICAFLLGDILRLFCGIRFEAQNLILGNIIKKKNSTKIL